MSSLAIGKALYSLLQDISPKKVFPLVAENGTSYPFIVYRRTSLATFNTKDICNYLESANVEIMIADNTYNGSIDLAEKVKAKMEHTRGEISGIEINNIKLVSADEAFVDDAYIQKLIFQVEITK